MKNILLAVCGLSPQVITETLYALHQNRRQVDAVHVITTRTGKEKIFAELLSGETGHYFQYLSEYRIDLATVDFNHGNIHVIRDHNGNEIADITDEEDNEHLLKKCLELTFHMTRNPDNAVFFSVAGGRKTMSSCLTLAAQMYGRPQDRIYHVLVSPEFESSREFYFPPKKSRKIELKKNGEFFYKETRYAKVNLIHIPFVSIRKQLSDDMLDAPKDPATLLASLVREERFRLCVNLMQKKLIFKNIELEMMPAHMALYTFFIEQKKNCTKNAETCKNCTDCFLGIQTIYDLQAQITFLYKKICGSRPVDEMSDTGIRELNMNNFNSYKSKISKALARRFGLYAVNDLEIGSVGTRPGKRYGILMDKSKIEVVY